MQQLKNAKDYIASLDEVGSGFFDIADARQAEVDQARLDELGAHRTRTEKNLALVERMIPGSKDKVQNGVALSIGTGLLKWVRRTL